jgi:hypothetical protein
VNGNIGPMQQNAIRSGWDSDDGKEDITVHVDDDEVFTGLLDVHGRKLMRSVKGPCGFMRQ